MSEQHLREIYRALREAQTRYTYFLLAAAGAAIGLAVNQTQNARLAWSHVPLGLAVLSWGSSFFCGCRHAAYVSSSLYSNAELLKVLVGQHPLVGPDPRKVQAASEGIRSALETNIDRANRYAHWQFRLLVLGAVAYIAWHVGQMYDRG